MHPQRQGGQQFEDALAAVKDQRRAPAELHDRLPFPEIYARAGEIRRIQRVIADKGHDGNPIRDLLAADGDKITIPSPRSTSPASVVYVMITQPPEQLHCRLHWLFASAVVLIGMARASAGEGSRTWPTEGFLPLSEARIAALPSGEQGGWREYLQVSIDRARRVAGFRDLIDHSLMVPIDGPPIPSTYSRGVRLDAPRTWYATEEARAIADHIANWQTVTGGWVKGGDYTRDRQPADDHHNAWSAGTFDNDATIYELRFLALVVAGGDDAARSRTWRESFDRGLDYVFASQFPNGGFPQIYPLVGWYHDAITFNDDAMVHILELLRHVGAREGEFAFLPATVADEAQRRFARGVACVLAAQRRAPDGQRTIWGQQYDPLTLQPCAARNFEPVAEASHESAGIVEFLMGFSAPTTDIVDAVDGAVAWFSRTAMHGLVWDRDHTEGTGLVPREGAPDLWARFYEIGTGRPIFGERDRTIHYAVTELCNERRRGYGWYTSRPAAVVADHAAWRARVSSTRTP